MRWIETLACAAALLGLPSCGGDSSEPTGGAGAAEALPEGVQPGVPTVVLKPGAIQAAVGEEVQLAGTLYNRPADINRWFFSVAWHFGDSDKYVGRPLDERQDVYTETTHAWKAAGTYEVKLEVFGGNNVVAESTLQAVIE